MKKLSLLMMGLALAASANAADLYLVGGFNGWTLADASAKFTEEESGVYSLNYDGTLTSGFKVNDGTWANDAYNIGGDGSTPITLGEAYTYSTGGSSKDLTLAAGAVANPKIVLDMNAGTILVTGAEAVTTTTYDLWGNFDGSTTWASLALTETDGKWVSAKTAVEACNFGIRELTNGAQTSWWSAAGSATVTLDTPLTLQIEGSNFSLAAGEYVFTLDMEAKTLTVSGEGGQGGDDPVPPTPTPGYKDLYIVGECTNWALDETYKMTREENVYTYTFANGVTGEWKIWDGTWTYSFGCGADQPVFGQAYDTWFNSATNYALNSTYKMEVKLTLVEGSDVADSSIPSILLVTEDQTSGVAVETVDAEEAVYYNLQGVQVANPTKGIYVKVAGGKAQKVYVAE